MAEAAEKPQRLGALDGLRGVAVALVFVYHYAGGAHAGAWWLRLVGMVNQAAWLGLSLFFVLSGYLITGNLWDGRRDVGRVRTFYVRRALRIFPLYYFSLVLVLVGAAMWGTLGRAMHAIWIPALFLQTVPSLSERVQQMPSPMLLHHFWSLAVEEQFYLLWPWLVWRARSRQRVMALCVVAVVASLAFRWWFVAFRWPVISWSETLPARAGELAAGAWLAMAIRGASRLQVRKAAMWGLAVSLVAFLAVSWRNGGASVGGGVVVVLGILAATGICGAVLALAVSDEGWRNALSVGWLRWLGRVSYGVYVFHILLRPAFWQVTHRLAPVSAGLRYFVVRMVVAAAGTLAAAWVSYIALERPFLRLKSRVASRRAVLASS